MSTKIKFLLTFLILLCFIIIPLPTFAAPDIDLLIDNNTLSFDVPPTIINGRTLVPLRIIFESLGATVQWDSSTKSITGIRDNITIFLQVDNTTALKNGQDLILDVPATILDNRTMVPARFIAEALGAEVNWNEATRIVEIKSNLPYDLTKYYILENKIRTLTSTLDENFYQEFETTIRHQFKPESYALMEAYLRRTYAAKKESNGIYTGPSKTGQVQGIYEWTSGGKYVGNWLNAQMHGKGAYYWPDGGKYVGEWQNSRRTGWGILYTADGDVYVGEWLNDNMEGHGIYYWENGELYRGQWNNDQRSGLGIYSWSDGNEYIGQLAAGEMVGIGSFTWHDGEQYLGEYQAGFRDGEGVYYWNPDFSFRGEYVNDNRTWGTYQGPSGKILNLKENAQNIVSQVTKPEMSPREKLKALHDYLALLTSYDRENFQTNTIPQEAHTAYGVFVNQKAVCDGYAEALHSLLEEAGIENMIVKGEAKSKTDWEGHAWLIVKIDDKYSHVDVTWADLDNEKGIDYTYYLVSDQKISQDHKWDTSLYPQCP